MGADLTIVIVTKNRPVKLARCLASIRKQSVLPSGVLIIDNDVRRSAFPVYREYKNSLNLYFSSEKRQGVPWARNKALKYTKSQLLGFVDDDCVLDKRWSENVVNMLSESENITYVVGDTKLYNKNNLFALAQHSRDNYWKLKTFKNGNETTRYHFDTKNVVIKLSDIKSKNVKFDPKCSINEFDSGDFDFGLNLAGKSLKGVYLEKMILFHEETSGISRFIKRAYYRGKIAKYISKKWDLGNVLVNLPARNFKWWFFDSINNFAKEKRMYTKNLKINNLKKILITILIRIHDRIYLQGYLSFNDES